LIVEQGGQEKSLPIPSSGAVLGRGKGSTIRIPSAEVSRRHCQLRCKDGFVTVEDLESVNGTFLNGEPVDGEEVVRPGDRLKVGPVTFVVEYKLSDLMRERMDGEDVEEVQMVEEEEAGDELPVVEDAVEDVLPVVEEAQAEDEATIPADDLVKPDFDFESSWKPPEGADLRDLLSQMEDEEPSKPASKKKRKREDDE
jgi:predicted component of type VI protein secretion system